MDELRFRNLNVLLIVLSLSFLFWMTPGPLILVPVSGTTSPVVVAVQAETYANFTDPSYYPGTILNVTVGAFNLPSIIDRTQGGLQGFDITLDYNSSMIRPVLTSFDSPFCSSLDECLFTNVTEAQALTFSNQTDLSAGSLRVGMVAYNSANRVSGSGVLFKVGFTILARGLTPITVDTANSQLIGYAQGCGAAITNYLVENSWFDNRQPWIVLANPSSVSLSPGSSATIQMTVVRVNSDANVTLIAPWGNYPFMNGTFTPRTGILTQSTGQLNFTSTLTIKTNSTAPLGRYVVPIVAHDSAVVGGYREYRLNYTIIIGPLLHSLSLVDSTNSPNPTRTIVQPVSGFLPYDPPLPVLANFTYAASSSNRESVIFASSVCGGTQPYTYSWSFGDGTSVSGNIVSHTFSAPGLYKVTLKVSDSTGSNFTVAQYVNVNVSSGASDLIIAGGLVLLLIIGVVGVYIWRRRRH